MFGIGTQEILFILLIVLLFFGGKKIPELMKGLGKGVKSFKDGMNGVETPQDKSDKVEEAESEKHSIAARKTVSSFFIFINALKFNVFIITSSCKK